MKKTISLILGAVLCLSLLAACGTPAADPTPTPTQAPATPEELAAHYKEAIEAARDDEDNEYNPLYTTGDAEESPELLWAILGFTADDLEAYSFALSPMNTKAYCVGIFKPAADKESVVNDGLKAYIESMQTSFEHYLPDQGEIANNAILETLDDGAILLVMSHDQDTIRDSIVAAL